MTRDNVCSNCRLPFGSSPVVREIMIEMDPGRGVDSSSRGKKLRYKSVGVKNVLSVYKLDFLDKIKCQSLRSSDQDKEDDERSMNCDFGICCTCSNHLTQMFKYHREFTERQARGSFLDRRMKRLDQVLDHIVTTSLTPAVKTEQIEHFKGKKVEQMPVDGLLLHDNGIAHAEAFLTEPECLKKSKILNNLMKFLSTSDLKSCRLVTKPWLKSSTALLVEREALEIRVCYSGKENSYIQSGSGHPIDDQLIEERPTLELLMQCIAKSESKSTNFPSTQFHFTGGTLSSADAQNFFFSVGLKITQLTLSSTQISTLWKILTLLPHLQKLTMTSHLDYYKAGKAMTGGFPSIKCIEFGSEFKITKSVRALEKLLPACSNLQLIEGAWRLDVELLVRTRTIHTVKTWASDSMTNVQQLFKFALQDLQLKEFVINDATKYQGAGAEILRALMIILNKAWTLEKLTLAQLVYESGKTFPESFVRLKQLCLQSTSHKEGERYFPVGINLDKTFPKLKILSFLPNNNNSSSETCWENIFPSPIKTGNGFIGRFSSVTTLNLADSSCSLNFLRVLHDLVPKVIKLRLNFYGSPTTHNVNNNIENLLPELCRVWQHLKVLELKFGNILPNLDDLIIGFVSESLGEAPWNFDSIKRGAWIGDMKDLESFRISFAANSLKDHHHPRIPFTKISGLGAFKLMPDLAVSVHCKISKGNVVDSELQLALDSISPYASIVVDSV